MWSNRVEYGRALERWDAFHDAKEYSAPERIGRVALIVANFTHGETRLEKYRERRKFIEDAREYARGYESVRRNSVQWVTEVTRESVAEVLRDDSISTMVFYGHGSFSSVVADDGSELDWRFVAEHTTHLKLGHCEQRTCGHFDRGVSVPFGLFAMAHPSRVTVPAGMDFRKDAYLWKEKELIQLEEAKIKPVVEGKDRLEYEDILELYSH
jgi:hypothetical protein